MERFVIGHNADPSNWRTRLEILNPQCLEIFVPPRYCTLEGLSGLENVFKQMASHPAVQQLEFLSCHFPWGETIDGYSRYHLIDDSYFRSLWRIAAAFDKLCRTLDLVPERSALNFHNLYELPRPFLLQLKQKGKLPALRDIFLRHADEQTLAARKLLEVLDLRLMLATENNPPIGAAEYMSIIDVFAADLANRAARMGIKTCLDLSHFFMTKFYYDLEPDKRPVFPYLDHECENPNQFPLDFESFQRALDPLYYHVSDTKAPGTDRNQEGVAIGTGDTPWIDVLTSLGKHAFKCNQKAFLIIEIKGAYTTEGMELCRKSEQALRGYIEDCFASGFLEALEQ
ncbi:MAG: hypothetical protein C4520_16135 [Candidatus Abyssobacteria bacterium SURF_5]|uniref:Sugar phosphate isomerase/epimerase n=1 Tax=Abyssobacteria bacterium (strain SURF_5) TaxID=2093360 RepID=A0A3A4NFM3_ABYX5|nr:MAG: hypothetical protein C4520_16135 [Candidatus Abyssubacteria bacterium SURF_5]